MKSNTRVTRLERKRRNLQMYSDFKSGATVADIAEKYGCSQQSVRSRFKYLGVSLRDRNKQLTIQMHAEHCAGADIAGIADKHGYSPESIRARFEYAGLPLKDRARTTDRNKQLTMQMHAEHCAGADIAAIAEKYGYSRQAIAGRFRRLGLPAIRRPRRSINPHSGVPVTCSAPRSPHEVCRRGGRRGICAASNAPGPARFAPDAGARGAADHSASLYLEVRHPSSISHWSLI